MDLNLLASDSILNGDVDMLKRWVEYSLQPENILQVIFDSKRYECLPVVLPFLSVLFEQDNRHPLGVNILLDLLERKVPLPHMTSIDRFFLLEQAVQRKIVIDFTQNKFLHRGVYHSEIIKQDCIELFVILREDILVSIAKDPKYYYEIIPEYMAVRVFEAIPLRLEDYDLYFYNLLQNYTDCFADNRSRAKFYERMIRHVISSDSLQEHLQHLCFYLQNKNYFDMLASLVRLGFQMSKQIKELIHICKPKEYTKLFGEDV